MGWNPKHPLDTVLPQNAVEAAKDFSHRLKSIVEHSLKLYLEFSSWKIENARKNVSEPNYIVGDKHNVSSEVLLDPDTTSQAAIKRHAK